MAQRRSASTVTLGLSVLLCGGSAYLCLSNPELPCEKRAPMTVLATLAAFLIALAFRQLATSPSAVQTRTLILCLALAAGSLFADVRFVMKYRTICSELEQQLHRMSHPAP